MNNEPVAYAMFRDGEYYDAIHPDEQAKTVGEYDIPLYLHPAKCGKCNDTEWVCENHPDQEAHKCIYCEGAGKPCKCAYPAKTLTDEEIGSLIPNIFYMDDSYSKNLYDDAMKFARAILKKVQEK